jgi:hypothetical protein
MHDLTFCGEGGAEYWVEQSVRDVIARSAAGSLSTAKSALRGWAAFADQVLGEHLPPSARGLAAWSQCFRCSSTFSNYVSYLKLGCCVLGLDHGQVDGPLLKRAKAALKKRGAPPKEKKHIRADMLRKLMEVVQMERDDTSAMLYLAAYTLLLRVPSEGLPMTVGDRPEACLPPGWHSSVAVVGGELVLRLARRKHMVDESVLRRACLCPRVSSLCIVHELGRWWPGPSCG